MLQRNAWFDPTSLPGIESPAGAYNRSASAPASAVPPLTNIVTVTMPFVGRVKMVQRVVSPFVPPPTQVPLSLETAGGDFKSDLILYRRLAAVSPPEKVPSCESR